tara:strand:- start:3938 stop:4300 length:363 start_codon:yes stop_codon:yes gene_type:complete
MAIPVVSKILAQARGTTSLTSTYSPAAGKTAKIYKITVANTSDGASDFSICLDDNGTTYDESTALAWLVKGDGAGDSTAINEYTWDKGLPMDESGNIAILSAVNNAHTFTIVGDEFTKDQ